MLPRKRKYVILLLTVALVSYTAFAQDANKEHKCSLDGYLKNMQNVWIENFDNNWIIWNSINNRLDLKWYPNNKIYATVGMRNQLQFGQIVKIVPDYDKMIGKDYGLVDLTAVIGSNDNYVLFTNIDRLSVKYTVKKFEFQAGRQRINWGRNLIWNPNDIYNSFSYFDFDYEERPGSDAILVQYYANYTSTIDLACKIDHNDDITLAAMYKFNKWNYDIQFLGGIMTDDIVLGAGWAGQIGGSGFRGEFSYFINTDDQVDTASTLIASIDWDYTFKSSLYVHLSALYNNNGTTGKAGMRQIFINEDITAKNLTLARAGLFGQLSYPVSPLVNAGIASIFNPYDLSSFIGPSVDISLRDDLYLLLMSQIFTGTTGSEYGDYGALLYIRMKWSF